MSEPELIEAYVNGGISRRVFIRGLIATGASLAVALAYAETIAPSAAAETDSGYADGRPPPPGFGEGYDH
jgi:hypothetical protein